MISEEKKAKFVVKIPFNSTEAPAQVFLSY